MRAVTESEPSLYYQHSTYCTPSFFFPFCLLFWFLLFLLFHFSPFLLLLFFLSLVPRLEHTGQAVSHLATSSSALLPYL